MRVELVTIGSELLLGYTLDENAAYLARVLADSGIEIARRATVGDDAAAIASAVGDALARTSAVITTGGLGPTSDDLTKPAIAGLFGRRMRLDESVLKAIEDRYRSLGHGGPVPASNRQQAMIPEGATILINRHGSAPGIWLEDERGRWVAMLPGVPREMRGMLADELLPRLVPLAGPAPQVVMSRTLRTTGIGESAIADLLGDEAATVEGLPLAYLPGWEGADLRLTVSGLNRANASERLERAAVRLRSLLRDHFYGEGSTDLAAVVLDQLRARSLTVVTAESCTAGMLGARITAIPGSSDVYLGGVIAYANEMKTALLGVDEALIERHGAVSEAVVMAMAASARDRLGGSVGIGITGIAGPTGGTPEKPVGLVWVAISMAGAERSYGRVYVGDRHEIRRRSTQAALDMLRRLLRQPVAVPG